MQREITMESVFRAGFDAGFEATESDFNGEYPGAGDENLKADGVFAKYYDKRAAAWLDYVKTLEAYASV